MSRPFLAFALALASTTALLTPDVADARDKEAVADWKAQVRSQSAFEKLHKGWFKAWRFGSYKKMEKLDAKLADWSVEALDVLQEGPRTSEAKAYRPLVVQLKDLPIVFDDIYARKSAYVDKSGLLNAVKEHLDEHVDALEAAAE